MLWQISCLIFIFLLMNLKKNKIFFKKQTTKKIKIQAGVAYFFKIE